jgi:hypothetical protein
MITAMGSCFGGVLMKKFVLILFIFAVAGGSAFAFDILSYPPPLEGGNVLIDLGIAYAGYGSSGGDMKIPPIVLTGDYCLSVPVPISVGAMFGIEQRLYYYWSGYEWKYTYLTFAVRGNWHWNIPVNWLDLYTGLSMGHQYWSVDYNGPYNQNYNYASGGKFYWGIQSGARFYFTKNIGAVAEFGYPIYAKAGLALKF